MGVPYGRLGLSVPQESDQNDVPGDMTALVDSMEGKLHTIAPSVSELIALHSAAPDGALAYAAAEDRLVARTSAGGWWKTVIDLGSSTYTPTWRADSTTGTALSLGDGQIYGRYSIMGRWVDVEMLLIRGGSTNTGPAGSPYMWSLPVAAADRRTIHGTGMIGQGSGIECGVYGESSTYFGLRVGAIRVGQPAPPGGAGWSTGHWISAHIRYRW